MMLFCILKEKRLLFETFSCIINTTDGFSVPCRLQKLLLLNIKLVAAISERGKVYEKTI